MPLDRVAQRRAGAMRLDIVDVGRRQAGIVERRADQRGLRRAVRRGEAGAAPVLVDRAAAQHCEHRIAVAQRVRQPLQHDDPGALAPPVAVGPRIEALAATVGGQHARARETCGQSGREHQADPAGQRQFAFPAAQRPHRGMHRDQRGGAGGVQGQGRSVQVEQIGDATGGDRGRGADAEVAVADLGDLRGRQRPGRSRHGPAPPRSPPAAAGAAGPWPRPRAARW